MYVHEHVMKIILNFSHLLISLIPPENTVHSTITQNKDKGSKLLMFDQKIYVQEQKL